MVFGTFFGIKPYKARKDSVLPDDVKARLGADYNLFSSLWKRYEASVQGNWGTSSIPSLAGFESWLLKRLKEDGRLSA